MTMDSFSDALNEIDRLQRERLDSRFREEDRDTIERLLALVRALCHSAQKQTGLIARVERNPLDQQLFATVIQLADLDRLAKNAPHGELPTLARLSPKLKDAEKKLLEVLRARGDDEYPLPNSIAHVVYGNRTAALQRQLTDNHNQAVAEAKNTSGALAKELEHKLRKEIQDVAASLSALSQHHKESREQISRRLEQSAAALEKSCTAIDTHSTTLVTRVTTDPSYLKWLENQFEERLRQLRKDADESRSNYTTLKDDVAATTQRLDQHNTRLNAAVALEVAQAIVPHLGKISEALATTKQLAAELEQKKAELADIMGPAMVSKNAKHFQDEALRHRNASMVYGAAALTLTVSAVVAAFAFYWLASPTTSGNLSVAHYLSTKIFVFVLLSSLIAVCVHGFRKSQHNAVLNQHRANALSSFFSIGPAAAKGTPEYQALLTACARVIFEHRSTGFDAGEKHAAATLEPLQAQLQRLQALAQDASRANGQ
ncbi:MAG: hypothetical protein IT463_00290 [Planctomycetes bacterium]|nr:hypothetical protein [Planctomycetota bacterium]